MAKTLEEVRDDMYEIFNRAAKVAKLWDPGSGSTEPHFSGTANAAANAAHAITAIEREIAIQALILEAQKDGSRISIEIDKGLERSVKVPTPIKLKQD